MKTSKLALALICLALFAGVPVAQIPGDGIPDVYYFAADGTAANGVSLPAGWLTVDTDGSDMVALLIGSSQDVTTGCASPADGLCNNGFLPDPNAAPFFVSAWTAGNINGSNQYVRTSPLDTLGYQGVIGQDDNPANLFPQTGLANFGLGATFDSIFDDGTSEALFQVTFATLDSGTIFTDVTVVPEPATMSLFGMALLGMFGLRRRS